MRLLLDTHALIWWSLGHPGLSSRARAAIADDASEVFVSAASVWEVAIKFALGKFPEAGAFVASLKAGQAVPGMTPLPILAAHAVHAGLLATSHKDPFDRMLIAQAQLENLLLVSNERLFDSLGVIRIWD